MAVTPSYRGELESCESVVRTLITFGTAMRFDVLRYYFFLSALVETALNLAIIVIPSHLLVVVHQPCILHRHYFRREPMLADC